MSNKRLQKMINAGIIPDRGGVFIDAYNQHINESIAMTITTRVNTCNHYYVTEPLSVAMRGRNPKNPSERKKSNGKYKQRIEVNMSGVANTITSVQKDSMLVEPIRISEATTKGYAEAYNGDSINLAVPNSNTRRGRVGKQMANTLDTGCQQATVQNYRIRKLTPTECFRLMGVDDEDINKLLSANISNTQLYKCAGNSIVVDVLYYIFKEAFVPDVSKRSFYQPTLF